MGSGRFTTGHARWVWVIVALAVGGCAAGPGGGRPATPYKGDAVWNIATADHGVSRC